jgi:3-hydroxyisobutyrate dehydrogenase-like beta-hydroxyacid dehydrogenase
MELGTIGAGAFAQAFAKRTLNAGHTVKLRARSGRVEPFLRSHGRACPGHPRLSRRKAATKTWMPATSAGMTMER